MTTILPTLETKPSFHLKCQNPIEGEQLVTNFFNSLFDIKKLVLVKNSTKDKHLIREIVLILNSHNNADMLMQPHVHIADTKVSCTEVTVEEAEELIRINKTKLYVGNIPFGIDNIKLWKHFARFGALDYTYIIKKPDRKSKGFGFIIYEEREGFEKAIKSKHYIEGQRLICKIFLNKSQLSRNLPSKEEEETGLKEGKEEIEEEKEDSIKDLFRQIESRIHKDGTQGGSHSTINSQEGLRETQDANSHEEESQELKRQGVTRNSLKVKSKPFFEEQEESLKGIWNAGSSESREFRSGCGNSFPWNSREVGKNSQHKHIHQNQKEEPFDWRSSHQENYQEWSYKSKHYKEQIIYGSEYRESKRYMHQDNKWDSYNYPPLKNEQYYSPFKAQEYVLESKYARVSELSARRSNGAKGETPRYFRKVEKGSNSLSNPQKGTASISIATQKAQLSPWDLPF